MGAELHKHQKIDTPRDVFYLELLELTGAFNGTGTTSNLRVLINERKAAFEGYESETIADRFTTSGPVFCAQREAREPVLNSEDAFKGTGACPGVITGRVCLVTDPTMAQLKQGEILVAQQTDPGWVMLFPLAAGLLVERGSLLSHSAIVARELNLPAVVSIPNLMQRLKDGDWVQLNGRTGEVAIIDPPADTLEVTEPELVDHD